jgi:hypothetical protein
LRVLGVISGVGEVVSVGELYQPRIFDASVLFIVRFGRQHRLRTTLEVDAIGALGVAEA